MTIDKLPPVPKPHILSMSGYSFSAEQMYDYGQTCAAAAIERCAQVVEGPLGLHAVGVALARVIRSLRWK
jgi:hypothetical protein